MKKIRLKQLLIVLFALLLLGAVIFFFFLKPKPIDVSSDSKKLNLLGNLPSNILASDNFQFEIAATPQCLLKVNSAWGIKTYDLSNGMALSKEFFSDAGQHFLTVWCNYSKVESKTLTISSLKPHGKIESYVGSKSIPADNGLHWSMFTVLPVDQYNNMVVDNSSIYINILRPNGQRFSKNVNTKDGIGYLKISSKTRKGKTLISTTSGNAYGKEKELLELPNFPSKISIKAESDILYADSRQFLKIITKELFDLYGNRVSDGTLITFKVIDSKGNSSFYRTYAMDGLASVNIQNPDYPGNLTVVAYIDNLVQSQSLILNFKPYVTDFKVKLGPNSQYLTIGPVIGPLRQLVSDGKEAAVFFEESNIIKKGIIRDGYAEVEIPKTIFKRGKIVVTMGGLQKRINF
jgi:hypothetical protein